MARLALRSKSKKNNTWKIIIGVVIFILVLIFSLPFLLPVAAVFGFYEYGKSIEKREARLDKVYAPVLNPHPKYFFTIKGHMDKALMKVMTPRFYANYATTNLDCYKPDSVFSGGKSSRIVTATYHQIDKNGEYLIDIPIDKYLPGDCQWKLSSVSESVYKEEMLAFQNAGEVVFFDSHPTNKYKLYGNSDYQCSGKGDCKISSHLPFTRLSNEGLGYCHNYTYTVNYMRRKK